MARNKEHTRRLTCPECGSRGEVTWEETEDPAYPGSRQRITSLIRFAQQRNVRGEPDVVCGKCRHAMPLCA